MHGVGVLPDGLCRPMAKAHGCRDVARPSCYDCGLSSGTAICAIGSGNFIGALGAHGSLLNSSVVRV